MINILQREISMTMDDKNPGIIHILLLTYTTVILILENTSQFINIHSLVVTAK